MAKNAVRLGRCLEELDEKRRGVREKAITTIVGILTAAPSHKFLEDKCTTIYCQCLTRLATEKKSSKKFSNTEVKQAVRALSLLAISLVDEDQTFEVYEECLVVLSAVLDRYEVYEVDTVVEVLGCLGMLGVSGARSSMEIDKGIMAVWKFIMDNDNKPKLPPAILASAIRAWSFLLAGLCRWNLSYKYCKTSISYLSNIVEGQDCDDLPDYESDCDDVPDDVPDNESDCDDIPDYESVVLAATDALALIFDTDFLANFSHESKAEKDYSSLEKEVKAKFNKRNKDVLKYLDQKCAKLSHVFQMKTIKTFLGEKGFASHMHTNENLQRLFESVWANGRNGEVLAPPERDDLVLKFYQPQAGTVVNSNDLLPHLTQKQKKIQKRMLLSSSSNLNKARTQLLSKQRQLVSSISFETEYYD